MSGRETEVILTDDDQAEMWKWFRGDNQMCTDQQQSQGSRLVLRI